MSGLSPAAARSVWKSFEDPRRIEHTTSYRMCEDEVVRFGERGLQAVLFKFAADTFGERDGAARAAALRRSELAAPVAAPHTDHAEGLIVALETDAELRYAATALPGLRLATYEVTFNLNPVSSPA